MKNEQTAKDVIITDIKAHAKAKQMQRLAGRLLFEGIISKKCKKILLEKASYYMILSNSFIKDLD